MNKKTMGAWIIHHSHKLQGVSLATSDYEQINFAGKCGIVLNALAASTDWEIPNDRIAALAQANGIAMRLELPTILTELERQRLIDKGENGISVLGLTSAQTLEHTATIFEESSPVSCERAAIALSEKSSDLPIQKEEAAEYISDTYQLASQDTGDILRQCEEIGFFDVEDLSGEKIYFNGNLFRRKDIAKANAVISSLNSEEERKVVELSTRLTASGCVAKNDVLSK
ncbi:MAG: hypothetical protein JST85_10305 [Acidobacteria bacterium]|nr:hypothetical protein [Acidobacteriota bacterium]